MLAVSLCGRSIESIDLIISIESVDSAGSIEARKMFLSARTSNKVIFQRADFQTHDFEKSFFDPGFEILANSYIERASRFLKS